MTTAYSLVTSFLQYLLLAPSYINVMNVYAFSNVHDVVSIQLLSIAPFDMQSWGTKGSDKVNEDLGVVKSHADNKNEVTVDVPLEQKDINAVYAAELQVLTTKPPKEEKSISADQKQEDYYKVSIPATEARADVQNFRTNVLLAWTMSNGALVAVILSASSIDISVELTF